MIKFTHKGNFNNLERFLLRAVGKDYVNLLNDYGAKGVEALQSATPSDSGETAKAWGFEIEHNKDQTIIHFTNDHRNDGCNIAIILQYGHGTKNGGYVEGKDYINEAIRPIFDELADKLWEEASK